MKINFLVESRAMWKGNAYIIKQTPDCVCESIYNHSPQKVISTIL